MHILSSMFVISGSSLYPGLIIERLKCTLNSGKERSNKATSSNYRVTIQKYAKSHLIIRQPPNPTN